MFVPGLIMCHPTSKVTPESKAAKAFLPEESARRRRNLQPRTAALRFVNRPAQLTEPFCVAIDLGWHLRETALR